jgi:hypothetical protein
MDTSKNVRLKWAAAAIAVAFAASCGGSSDSEKNVGTNGSGGSAAGSGGSGAAGSGGSTQTGSGGSTPTGSGGSGPAGTGGSGAAGSAGTGGNPGGSGGAGGGAAGAAGSDAGPVTADGMPGGCPSYASFTLAVHIAMDVTWPASTASNGGTGRILLWNLAKLNASGTTLTGQTQPCGNVLPPVTLNAVGTIAAGGSMVLVEVPNTVWDAPSIPRFESNGTLAGWNVGSAISITPTVVLVGLTMPDPMAAWPAMGSSVTAVDADGDGKLGFLAVPRNGTGFVKPPTALGLAGSAPSADQVYLASRTGIGLTGNTTTCDEQAGTIAVTFFDSHVVGCRIAPGQDCTAAQASFIDGSSPIYTATGGTFRSKKVADNATCADVRAAIPATM